MPITTVGVVRNGVIVPNTPLPDGGFVLIEMPDGVPEVPPELQDELAAWQQASANALALVESLAEEVEEGETDAQRWEYFTS